MKINRKLRIAAVSILGSVLLLFVILVAHIATAKPLENATVQVSRIDFDQPFDAIGAADVKTKILSIPGVKSDVLVKKNVVVYFHDNRIADSKKVFDQLMAKGNYHAKRFLVPENLASKSVCLVMNHDGFYYKFSKTVQKVFN
ncbi:hypothetical protein [Flavobacterium sp.]|uniref:hypothetical protein n=1 Tax=Flavobacterium sp. TaxID=239 RepID=UPI0026325DC5|nr:hypothetical protein [Flavobacterium sp.]